MRLDSPGACGAGREPQKEQTSLMIVLTCGVGISRLRWTTETSSPCHLFLFVLNKIRREVSGLGCNLDNMSVGSLWVWAPGKSSSESCAWLGRAPRASKHLCKGPAVALDRHPETRKEARAAGTARSRECVAGDGV